jgi:hypothetical protein
MMDTKLIRQAMFSAREALDMLYSDLEVRPGSEQRQRLCRNRVDDLNAAIAELDESWDTLQPLTEEDHRNGYILGKALKRLFEQEKQRHVG